MGNSSCANPGSAESGGALALLWEVAALGRQFPRAAISYCDS
jgi:hypothetical protein